MTDPAVFEVVKAMVMDGHVDDAQWYVTQIRKVTR